MLRLNSALIIIIATALMLSLSMGLRQSLGLFVQPLTSDIGVSVATFTFALAFQNLMWGLLQPVAGALAVRFGFRPIMITGAFLYAGGLLLLSQSGGLIEVFVGAGLFIGAGLACTAMGLSMAVASRVASDAQRSMILGIVVAAGSLGTLIAAPLGQMLASDFGWRTGVVSFFLLACLMIPAAWMAGRVDRIPLQERRGDLNSDQSALGAMMVALREPSFVVMGAAYFVCGMQLVFLTTHLPSYLEICGLNPMVGATALGVIGVFNVLGSLFFGWAGGRWNKTLLLGLIYVSRSVVLGWYFLLPPTPESTILFAAIMGFLWLGVGPLVSASIAEMFGLKWQAMLQGFAFMSHQVGSFVGAFGGGLMFDSFGSYDLAWRLGVGMGITAGVIQILFALYRPSERFAH